MINVSWTNLTCQALNKMFISASYFLLTRHSVLIIVSILCRNFFRLVNERCRFCQDIYYFVIIMVNFFKVIKTNETFYAIDYPQVLFFLNFKKAFSKGLTVLLKIPKTIEWYRWNSERPGWFLHWKDRSSKISLKASTLVCHKLQSKSN